MASSGKVMDSAVDMLFTWIEKELTGKGEFDLEVRPADTTQIIMVIVHPGNAQNKGFEVSRQLNLASPMLAVSQVIRQLIDEAMLELKRNTRKS
jgi:hypothetical protein